MSKNFYPQAISILGDPNFDFRRVCFELAQKHPKLFVAMAKGPTAVLPLSPVEKECVDLIRNGQFLGALRLYREKTGMALKEAKDACESLRSKYVPGQQANAAQS